MGSTDDARDDSVDDVDAHGAEAFDESLIEPGPRRSTYTPPPQPSAAAAAAAVGADPETIAAVAAATAAADAPTSAAPADSGSAFPSGPPFADAASAAAAFAAAISGQAAQASAAPAAAPEQQSPAPEAAEPARPSSWPFATETPAAPSAPSPAGPVYALDDVPIADEPELPYFPEPPTGHPGSQPGSTQPDLDSFPPPLPDAWGAAEPFAPAFGSRAATPAAEFDEAEAADAVSSAELPSFAAPAYEAPSFGTPTFEAPDYEAPASPGYEAPVYEAPVYEASAPEPAAYVAPEYVAPEFPSPQWQVPAADSPVENSAAFDALFGGVPNSGTPTSDAPQYVAPAYEAPSFEAPSFEAPSSGTPSSETSSSETPSFDAAPLTQPEQPVFEQPVFEQPVSEPVFEQPSFEPEGGFASSPPPEGEPLQATAGPGTIEQPTFEPAESALPADSPAVSPPVFESPEDQAAFLASHAAPAGQPWIPQRRSLTDDVLAAALDDAASQPGATLDAMEELERQMRLREEEAKEYNDWENSMLAVGTPEAIAAVEQVRPQFEGIVPTTTSIPIITPEAAAAAAAAAADQQAPGQQTSGQQSPEQSLPFWSPPPPSTPSIFAASADEQAYDLQPTFERPPVGLPAEGPSSDAFDAPAASEAFGAPATPSFDDLFSGPPAEPAGSPVTAAPDVPAPSPAAETSPAAESSAFAESSPFSWAMEDLPAPAAQAAPVAPLLPSNDEFAASEPLPQPVVAADPVADPFDWIPTATSALPIVTDSQAAPAVASAEASDPEPTAPAIPEGFSWITEPTEPAAPVASLAPADEAVIPEMFSWAQPETTDASTPDTPVADAPVDEPTFAVPPTLIEPPEAQRAFTSAPAPFDAAPFTAPPLAPPTPEDASAAHAGSLDSLFSAPSASAPVSAPVSSPLSVASSSDAPANAAPEAPVEIDPFSSLLHGTADAAPQTVAPQTPDSQTPNPQALVEGFASLDADPAFSVAPAAQSEDTAAQPGGTAAQPKGTAAQPGGTAAESADIGDAVFAGFDAAAADFTPGTTQHSSLAESDTDSDIVHSPITGLVPTGALLTAAAEEEATANSTADAVVLAPLPLFVPEKAGVEPTADDRRVGRAARQFWLWFAANSSILSLAFGGVLFSLQMSLRQAIIATLAGVVLSFIPLGLGTLAGKRSGQPTMVVSRATFGLTGNILPALISLLSRIFWGAALLWFLATTVGALIASAELSGGLATGQLVVIGLAAAFVVALVVAFFGYGLLARFQLVVSIISTVLLGGFVLLTVKYIDISQALTTADGPVTLVLTGAVLVFSFVGLVWANSSSDLARYQRPSSSGGGSMLWATFGTTLPTFLLISYGALLAASNADIAVGLITNPLDTLGRMLPEWYPIPLIAAASLSLISGVVISIYSGGFALQSLGLRLERKWSVLVVGALLFILALGFTMMTLDFAQFFRDLATTLAVPVAAWAGIFAAETMIRNRGYHARSLLTPGGIYPAVRVVNLVALVIISVIGYGLTTATVSWLAWQGFALPLLGIESTSDLATSDFGVLAALILGLLTPIVAGIPAIRRQEAAVATPN